MTKSEFETKFNECLKDVSMSYLESPSFKERLSDFSDQNGKISQDKMFMLIFSESLKVNSLFLKELLLQTLEFDD